ncbi:cell division cycle-associated protein 2 isoform X2 [Dunckerocampus dactyliophorus]|nr:cell division cycle-associated protein 2 isoform X2 [Dunckerocampus dactyliophorus]XP_054629626.1 cell division cycle-associated protein 2 isoform X2 [Dunckerocampus dactyliophorus]
MTTEQTFIFAKATDQKEKMLRPSQEDSAPDLRQTTTPLNFLTPSQFGISVHSFTPTPSDRKEKSRLAQLKARRKSSVGVRGSPETNSLIRFIAQQKMKNSLNCQSPQHVGSSPFLPRVASTLKQKIVAFQSLMNVEEKEVCEPMPRQDDNTGGCVETRDDHSDENNQDGGKENHPPVTSPAPSKRRRVGRLEGCQVKIREEHTLFFDLNCSDKEEDKALKESSDIVTKEGLPSSEREEVHPVLFSLPLHVEHEPPTSLELHRQDNVFEPKSSSQACPSDPTPASPDDSSSAFQSSSLPSVLVMKPAEEEDSSVTPAAKMKKRRVHFGGPLSPEFFDKHLPPSTPLQKGGTPGRAPTPSGIFKLRSALKTPQMNETPAPQDQPDLNSPSGFGASPVLAIPRKCSMISVEEDRVEENGKIIFPPIEDSDSKVISESEWITNAQLNLNDALQDELSPVEMSATQVSMLNELMSMSEEEQPAAVSKAPGRLRNHKKKEVAKPESTVELPDGRRSRKRKMPEESEPLKRFTRSATKPSEKIKIAAARRWKKEVNHSLYGSRKYASRTPSLSPIPESFKNQSSAPQDTPTSCFTVISDESPGLTNDDLVTAVAHDERHASRMFPMSSTKRTTRKNRRTSRPRGKRKFGVLEHDLPCREPHVQLSENHEDEIATLPGVSTEVPSVPERQSDGTEESCTLTAADPPSTVADSLTPDCPFAGEGSLTPHQAKSLSRSSMSLAEEQPDHTSPSAGSPTKKAQVDENLAPWQADFNFEDVFKPVATRGQRSVRRSLRNQKRKTESDGDTGLAWLPRISPESRKEAGKKSRRFCFALPVPVLPVNV